MISDSELHSLLYRIIKGRLRCYVDGLCFIIREPDVDLIEESFEIYQEAYDVAYVNNNFVKEQIIEKLIEQDLWTPHADKKMEELNKEADDLRVECYQNFIYKDRLRSSKSRLHRKLKEVEEILIKKHSLDYLSCEHIAETARQSWIISKSCFIQDKPVNWDNHNFNSIFSFYKENLIPSHTIRAIARSHYWRPIWAASKKIDLFGRPAIELTRDQLTLCSYSSMYDNVAEHQEAPSDAVINDDDCLDGWFIFQKRKYEKEKKAQETENLITNDKIKNSKEVFVMAKNKQEAASINDLNSDLSKIIVAQRKQVIQEKGSAKDVDFFDVQTEIQQERQQKFVNKMKGK